MKKLLSTTVLAMSLVNTAFSQQVTRPNWCGSIEAMDAHFMASPELKARFEAYQHAADAEQNLPQQRAAAASYTIPVVFHILHQYGVENISDAQINDQIAIFNRDFNRQNADTSVVITPFKNLIGDVHFAFALAKKDPNGNCTSGINRYYDTNTASWTGNPADYIYTWDPTRYLNIYVVRSIASGAAGYAYYPGSLSNGDDMDAILILSNYVGSIGTSSVGKSRALTHEVGHWFNLQHVWGNTNNPGVACGNDQVSDTPITKGFTSCPLQANSDVCNAGVYENYQNYMDYSYCSVMFTPGQATRMTNAINNGVVGRNNLSSASNLSFTGITPAALCAPNAIFSANRQVVCVNQSVNFSDMSNISTPTSWNWTFQGGSPATSSVQNPTVSYSTPGIYSVSLTASNSNGSTSVSMVNYVTVIAAPQTASLQEGFETSAIPNTTWSVRNMAGFSTNWQQTPAAQASGSKSAKVDQSIASGTSVELYSPTYNFASMPGVALSLKWAGAERDTSTHNSFDIFSVQFSTDCGATWSPRLNRTIKTGNLGVSPLQESGSFIPASSQFYQENVPLAGLTSEPNIMFKLKFTAETGSSNHFYIDDINLTSLTGIAETPLLSNVRFFPNPASQLVNIEFDLVEKKDVSIDIKDMLGRVIQSIGEQTLTAGHQLLTVPLNHMASGVYFLSLNSASQITTQKLIIE